MNPYPAYRDSGVEWLGELPEHWELTLLRRAVRLKAGEGITSEEIEEEGDYPVFGGNGTRGYTTSYTHEGEFVLIGRQGALCGNVHLARGKFWASEHAVVATPANEISVAWLGHTLDMMRLNQYSDAAAQPGLAVDRIRSLPLPLPPLDEQRAIAAYLDRETERIDALVAKKRLLIERLEEYRTALITRTVTRGLPPEAARAAGLDPSPRLKPSGVEWLGEVPEHWEVGKVALAARRIQAGSTPPTANDEYYEDGTVPWFGPSAFRGSLVLGEPTKLLNEIAIRDGVVRRFEAGTVMVVTIASVGKVGLLATPASCNQQITGITFDERMVFPTFAGLQLSLLGDMLKGIAPAATLPILSQSDIGHLALLIPPLDEQCAIAAYLDDETERIDALVVRTETAIERSQEYRTALITAAVTGKIDVRE